MIKHGETRRIMCFLNNEKTIKTSFYYYKKMIFENTRNTKNNNTPSFPNSFLVFFIFKNRSKTILENNNQIGHKSHQQILQMSVICTGKS